MDVMMAVLAVAPSLLTGAVLFYWQRAQRRRDEKAERRATLRKQESILGLNLQMAGIKLAIGTALAVKNQQANGEMEEGLEACEDAKKAYVAFLNERATDHLQNI